MWKRACSRTMAPMRRILTAACAAAALMAMAGTAQAATISLESGSIVYRGEGSEGLSLLVSTWEDWETGTEYLMLRDSGADRQAIASGPCFMSTGYDPSPLCPLDPAQPLIVYGSAADDDLSVYFNGVPANKTIQLHGLGGDDEIEDASSTVANRYLTGGPGNDTIEGYGGDDTIDGGDGNDVVDGGADDDTVRGGAGDDELWGDHYQKPGRDLLDGGPGFDRTGEWGIPGDLTNQPRTNVTVDGVANDGRPGEGDNVVSVEKLEVYVVGDYAGTEGADIIKVLNPGNEGPSSLSGRGGNDVLVAEDFDDVVDGGAGDDTVEGGHGNDTVTGGAGRDTIYGDATSSHCSWYSCKIPFGNDTILARDGVADNVDCGIGTDRAVVDAIDVVSNCETVEGARGGGGGGGGAQAPLALAVVGKRSVKALAAQGLRVSVTCPAACTVSGALHADRTTARKLGVKRGARIGSGSGRAAAAGKATVKLKLARKVKRKFKRLRKATVTVKLTVKSGGASRTVTRAVKLAR